MGILLLIGWVVGDLWGVLLLGGLMCLIFSYYVMFFINFLCYMWGKRLYIDENIVCDNFWLVIVIWGEGYYNYYYIF